MKLLAFSDLHRDRRQATHIAEMSKEADVAIGAGDFASWHLGLGRVISAMSAIRVPLVLVPGNNESADALSRACSRLPLATVLHGNATEVGGVTFFGLGGAVPPTPLPWSFDLDENEARSRLSRCPEGAVLISHSPPRGCVDEGHRAGMGSVAVREAVERKHPPLVICGHIHQQGGRQAMLGDSRVANVGPRGMFFEL